MKKIFLSLLFSCITCTIFAQNDKLLIGKWSFVDITPPTEALKTMTKEQLSQSKVMMKKIAEKSYFEFTKDKEMISFMDIGFGEPEPISTKYELLEKNTVLHIFPNEVQGKSGKQSVQESRPKIEKLTKTELVLTSTEGKNKGMKMIMKRAK